ESDLQIVRADAEAVGAQRAICVPRPARHSGEMESGLDRRIDHQHHVALPTVLPDRDVLDGAPWNKLGRDPAIPNPLWRDGDDRTVARECSPHREQCASSEQQYPDIAGGHSEDVRVAGGMY